MVGVGELAIMLLGVLTYTGFTEALIQREGLTQRLIQTAWWVILGRAAIVAGALWLAAPYLAAQFDPRIAPVIRALALIQLVEGLNSIGLILLHKEMQFRQLFRFEAWGLVMDLAVAIAAALLWRNVWALVLGAAAGALTRLIMSYVLYPSRPRFVFDLKGAKQLFSFGQWLLFSGLLYFSMFKGTEAMSGYLFGVGALGLYQMAAKFALAPVFHFGEVFLEAVFPAYSQIQAKPDELKEAFLKVLQVATLIIFPLSTLMVVVIGPLIPLLMGSKWQGIVALVPGLAIGGAIQALLRTGPPLFMAKGRTVCQFRMDFFAALGILLCIYPFSRGFGFVGLTWSYATGICLGLPLWWRAVRQESQAATRELVVSVAPALIASLILALFIWFPSRFFSISLDQWSSVHWLVMLGLLGSVTYVIAILAFERYLDGYHPLQATMNLFDGRRG